jgi:two-component system response regulator YesN
MYRLLIVDDEPVIVNGMFELLYNQGNLDLDIYKAYSGEEAIEWANRSRLDIVLSDIRMPGIDGLQLLGELKRRWPRCRVIFLTVHSEFDYIYRAVQEKGVGYILKTEPHERIFETIRACVRELDESKELERLLAESRNGNGFGRFLAQKDFIRYLIDAPGRARIEQTELESAGLRLDASHCVLLLIARVAPGDLPTAYAERTGRIDDIRLVVEERFSGKLSYAYGETSPGSLLWLLQGTESDAANADSLSLFVRDTMELVQDTVLRMIGCRLSFVVSGSPLEWRDIGDGFRSLEAFFDREIPQPEEGLALVAKEPAPSPGDLGGADAPNATRASLAIERVKAYIDGNLPGDISLVRLAEIAYLNPAYLSRLFKLVEGATLSEYIEDMRIARAKALLRDGDRKIQEIASLVGFESSSNFGRFFKRKVGLTPQEHREAK